MNKTEALRIVREACASVTANLQTHQMVQQALAVLERELTPPPAPPEPPKAE
jgi:hypothetical protein